MSVTLKGILSICSETVALKTCKFFNDLQSETRKRNLKPIDGAKLHITLIHQSCLKAVRKNIKKGYTLDLPTLPELTLDQGSIQMAIEGERQTLRLVLGVKDQTALKEYVQDFCKKNNVELDVREANRIFHVSFSNLTGLPQDSVR